MKITNEYKEQIKKLHQSKNWGTTSAIPHKVIEIIETFNIKSILDFGCGKGKIVELLKERFPNIEVIGYDPAFNTDLPDKIEMIMSTDVLEHVEPNFLDETLSDLYSRAEKVQYHLIACHKAKKILPDGRNAHLIIETPDWWQEKFRNLPGEIYFEDVHGSIKTPKKGPSLAVTKYECVFLTK